MTAPPGNVKRKIEAIMTAGGESRSLFFKSFLFAISIGYGGLVKLRENLYKKGFLQSKRLPCTVISIGNITVGGSGKTPMTIYMAELIKHLGYGVAIISRGYKGQAEKIGGVVCDGRMICMGPDEAGDEPFMISERLKTVPVIVGQNRFKAGILAIKEFKPDVLLLDDAFQHLKLNRDIDLVLLDSKKPFGNTYLFPRGTLRETASALLRGDAVIFTRSGVGKLAALDQIKRIVPKKPIFHSFHTPYIYKIITGNSLQSPDRLNISSMYDFDIFKRKRVFAFSGIASNDDFRRTIESFRCELENFLGFPDHHPYSNRELDEIVKSAMDLSAEFIFTTEKDYVRIAHKIKWPIDLVVIGIEISFGENDIAFKSFIKSRLQGLITG
ncbi:MAG: tetraacyldisaccharide 4'-kinase [Deltaproteobacteria bacterium]|nr:tetraacyldisaccharide 4'-kinase [Deltaproteobacteria bacterium]